VYKAVRHAGPSAVFETCFRDAGARGYPNPTSLAGSELSMGWVDPWVGSGWVEIFQFLASWVGSTIANVLKFLKDYVNAFKAR